MKIVFWNNRPEDRDEPKPTIALLHLGEKEAEDIEKKGGSIQSKSGCYSVAETLPGVTCEDLQKDG